MSAHILTGFHSSADQLEEQKAKVMKTNKTYTLRELAKVDVDSWAEAVSLMDDIAYVRREACVAAGLPNDETTEAPALVAQYEYVAQRNKFLFDKTGRIVSYEKYEE